jgi:NADH-quinone oxidoreductase subunit H
MNGTVILATLVKVLIMLGFTMNVAAILTWADRRQSAMIQDRVGPNRAVIKVFGKEIRLAGLLHPAADGVKFFSKEDFMPPKADKLLFQIAPMLAVAAVVALVATIPFMDTMCPHSLWRHVTKDGEGFTIFPAVARYGTCGADLRNGVFPVEGAVAPLNVGVLYVFAMAGQGIIGAAIAGWSSDNKFSLMGALRAASQMVSYEVTMGMSLIGAMMIYGTVRLDDMVRWQGDNAWGIFVQPLAFFLFFTAAVAESKRIPFDLPEAESELVSGYFTEYSGMKFGMFYLSEYMEVVTSSMLLVTIFLGGWELPFFHRDGMTISFGTLTLFHTLIPHIWMTVIGVLGFFGKVLVVCWLQTFVRWSLPRFRYDQLMKLGWKMLLPASLANICVTGIVYLAIDKAGASATDGLKVAADITQAVVAVVMAYFVARLVVGMFGTRTRRTFIVGSSADQASEAGGTKTTAMQA